MKFNEAKTLIAPVVDNGVNSGDSRIVARINEAQRRLIDQYNFLVRREQLEVAELVFQNGGTVPGTNGDGGTNSNLILDSYDATKVMVLALWREENNEMEMATTLEKKALDMIERDLVRDVEISRREEFQTLETNFVYDTLGNLTGRIGLETLARYRLPKARVQSYIRSAYRMAVDHYNFVIRREVYDLPPINNNSLPNDSSVMAISPEVIRELVINQMAQDQA